MNIFELALQNLTSPPVLAFALGLLATALRADLRLPEAVYQGLSFYLLLGIGIKGGVALRDAEFSDIALPIVGTIALGVAIPLLAFYILGPLTKLPAYEKGALAAHYGSTSLVTFTAALVFLESAQTFVEGYMATLLAVLEIPGIIVGLLLASRGMSRTVNFRESLTEVLTGKSIILLAGGLLLGALTGSSGYSQVEPFFGGLFTGVLTLFLLELGLIAGKRIGDLKKVGIRLVIFGIGFPVIAGTLGITVGLLTGLSVGGATILGVLSAASSYIAAPAAVRLALPEASPGIYLTSSLAITFPFNLIIGIPLYSVLAEMIANGMGI